MFSHSSINWCELDYVKSNFIAEYWNTLTGIFLCLSSIYCYRKNNSQYFYNLNYSTYLLFLVGIGTILFHGTLIYFWQLFDEIPMMLIVIEYNRILSTLKINHYTKMFRVNYLYMYMTIPVIISSYYIHPKLQVFTFQGSLVLFVILLLYTCNQMNNNLNKLYYFTHKFNYVEELVQPSKHNMYEKFFTKRKSFTPKDMVDTNESFYSFKKYSKIRTQLKQYNKKGLFLLFTSFLIWNIDNFYCQHEIELHAIWHITTSIGMYYCNEIMKSYLILERQFYSN